jgi:4-amino-4-deoxy-L-arabinose transferase-like glycosyltransferase
MVRQYARCSGASNNRIVIPGGVEESLDAEIRDVSTPLDMTTSVLEDRRTLWIIAALIVLLFGIANLPWQLDDYDQAKQAFTSFEMVKEGHWLYQHTPHERVATKPPLVGWISAALFEVTRSWEIAWRLPSVLAAVALAVILFRAAECAYGPTAALIALGAFGFNLLSPRLASLVRTDMPLAFVIFLIGLLIWRNIRDGTKWQPREQVCVFVLLTAAMLIKGPIVYAFLLPGIGMFQWWRGRCTAVAGGVDPGKTRNALKLKSAWPGWWPWVASFAIFFIWVIGGIRFQPGFYQEVVMREFVGRFGETIHRPQPLFFYFPHLLHKFAPWSVLMIAIAIVDFRSRNWRFRSVFREMSSETFWLLCWSIGGLIVMSLIPSKRVDRIFPVIPPLCLLLAAQINGRHAALRHPVGAARRRYLAILLAFAIVLTGGYTIAKVVTGYRDYRDALVVFGRNVLHEAEAHHWHYEVVSAKDEGLLLYLRKTDFIQSDRAVAEWNNGNLDALIASTEKVPALMLRLRGATLSQLKSNQIKKEQGNGYVLITR